MITESHMALLREEITKLRDRMIEGRTDLVRLNTVEAMVGRMLEQEQGGPFEKQLTVIGGLLRAVSDTTRYQFEMRQYAAALDRMSQ